MAQQLPLPFTFNPSMEFDQFHQGANAEPVRHLRASADGRGEQLIFLWGGEGTGKTHLLNACCRQAALRGRTVSYLPLATLHQYGPGVLEGLEHMDLVCLDDVHRIGGDTGWESALFELFNRLRELGHVLIAAAELPPIQLPIRLADLRTRLGWGLTLHLLPMADTDKLAVLRLYAQSIGLELPLPVARFLLTHYPRDLPALRRLLDQLDQATLAAKRKLSVPFVKAVLREAS